MTFMSADVKRVWVHNATGLKAKATKATIDGTSWLEVRGLDDVIIATVFLPFEVAEEYARAINSCNDREVVSAHENANTDT